MKKKKGMRQLALILSVTMIFSDTGLVGRKQVYAETKKNSSLRNLELNHLEGFSGIQNPQQPTKMEEWKGSYLKFGSYLQGTDGKKEPVRWRVLDTQADSNEDGAKDSYLLLSDQILDCVPFNIETADKNNWNESQVRKWLNETFKKNFSAQEQDAIAETTKKAGESVEYLDSPEVTGDKFFLLSANEAQKKEYGFWNTGATAIANTSNTLQATEYAKKQGVAVYDGYSDWWLRSKSDCGESVAGMVDHEGWIFDDCVSDDAVGVAPACELKTDSIAYFWAEGVKRSDFTAVDTDKSDTDTWNITLQASKEDLAAKMEETANGENRKVEKSETVEISHKSAKTVLKDATQVSAMLLSTDGEVLYYGKIDGNVENESSSLKIPTDIEAGLYQLYVFAEEITEGSGTACAFGEAIPLKIVEVEKPSNPSQDVKPSKEKPTEPSKVSSIEPSKEEPVIPSKEEPVTPSKEEPVIPSKEEPVIPSKEEPVTPSKEEKPTQPSEEEPTRPEKPSSISIPSEQSSLPDRGEPSEIKPSQPETPTEPEHEQPSKDVPSEPTKPSSTSIPSEQPSQPDREEPSQPDEGSFSSDKSYKVTVESGKGGGNYKEGEKVTVQAAEPEKGYKFQNWKAYGVVIKNTTSEKITFVMPKKSVVLISCYSPIIYALKYQLNGGKTTKQNPKTYTVESKGVVLENPVKEGYRFKGWTWKGQTKPQLYVEIPKGSTGERTFVANWEKEESSGSKPTTASTPSQNETKKEYIVIYQKNTDKKVSGMPSESKRYKEGTTIKVGKAPFCDSMFFAGWNTKADGSGKKIKPGQKIVLQDNLILYANWKKTYQASKLLYRVNGKNTVACTGTKDKKKNKLNVPNTITCNGYRYKVTEISAKAFYKNKKIATVNIGDNVKNIEAKAFYQCIGLKKVVAGKNLVKIETKAFGRNKKGCTIKIKSTKLKVVRGIQNEKTKQMKIYVPSSKKAAYKILFKQTLKDKKAKIF